MTRFSSKEGYKLYDDVLPARMSTLEVLRVRFIICIQHSVHELHRMKIQTGVTSNADSRVRE